MAFEELKRSGITEKTPENIVFGAGTIHRGLTFDPTTKKWNFEESLIGATQGGSTLTITPTILNIEADGKTVNVAELTAKTGEVATLQMNMLEITPEILKEAVIGNIADSADYEGFVEITSKARIEKGDYVDKLGFIGYRLTGEPIIVIFDKALCTSGLSLNPQNNNASPTSTTFECYAEITGSHDTLPYHILVPKAAASGASEASAKSTKAKAAV